MSTGETRTAVSPADGVAPGQGGSGVASEPVAETAVKQTSGKSTDSGKKVVAKSSGKPEVQNLPLTAVTDDDIQLGDDIDRTAKGWRFEQNSNGYYRWRWQLKDDFGNPVTYVNKSGKVDYKRGSEYVRIKEAKNRLASPK
jgi:hypothetical protein